MLTAGLGTRLRPLTLTRAKAAVPVDGEALVRRIIGWLVRSGVRELVLNLHHRPESITAAVGDGSDLGARVRYSWESPVLGSAGGPRHALPLLLDGWSGEDGRTLLLVNGDTLTNLDLAALLSRHRRSGARVTMALIPNPWPEKYGGALLDNDEAITGFTRRGNPQPSFHFIGVQAVEADVFSGLTDGVASESVLELYPRMISEQCGSVRGYVSDASFQDIGTPADLLETSLDLAAAVGRPGAPRWGHDVRVAGSARVTRSVLWDNVTVGPGAQLRECIVADGVCVPAGAEFERRAIVHAPDSTPGPGEERAGDLLVARLDR